MILDNIFKVNKVSFKKSIYDISNKPNIHFLSEQPFDINIV